MIPCPACKHRVFGPRDMLWMGLDGRAKCPECGALATLTQMSRFLVLSLLALLMWLLLLEWGIFYSGYLFVFSMTAIVVGWRLLCAAALPLLSMEKVPGHVRYGRRENIVTLAALMVTAVALDGLMSYQSEADKRQAAAADSSERVRSE
jgi:hypothetical protein